MSVGKKLKKLTSIILIIAMVMTSSGIQNFANSVDDIVNTEASDEKKESSSRKYYDEMMEEKGKEGIEDEETTPEEKPSEDESTLINGEGEPEDDTKKGDEADAEDEASTEAESSEENSSESNPEDEEFGPWREEESSDETTSNESTEESFDEKESNESKETANDETKEGEIIPDESRSVEESETVAESSSAFDTESTVASDSEIDTDTDTTEEDNTSTTSEADYVKVDEINVDEKATPSDIESVEKATPSDIESDVIATESILDFIDEGTPSEMGLYGKKSYGEYGSTSLGVPAIVVWGDVGYRGSSHVNEGYLGMYIGGTDDYNHGQEGHNFNSKKNEEGTNGLHYKGSKNIKNILSLEYKNRDEWMPAPQFIKHTGWYVQTRGKFAQYAIGNQSTSGGVRANNYPNKKKREHKTWTNDDLRGLWSDFLKVPFKSYGTVSRGGQHLETLINQQGGNFSILNNNQNIRGYIVNSQNNDGTYNLSLVENVKFNNKWGMKEKESLSSWHIESIDDEITQHTNHDEQYDWTAKFNTAYYGIHVTDAEGELATAVTWRNSGWKDGDTTSKLYAERYIYGGEYNITVPNEDKNVYWESNGKKYKLLGWVPSYHYKHPSYEDWERDSDADKGGTTRNKPLNENLASELYNTRVYKPGEKFQYIPSGRWPVTFGPFYRDAFQSTNPKDYREGYRYGMADKGAIFINIDRRGDESVYWNTITKVNRMRDEWGSGNGNRRRQIATVQYNTIFFSPALKEYKEKTATFDLNGGKWVDSKHSNTIKYNNFSTKTLPGASEVTRTGYTFEGWFTDATGGTKKTTLGEAELEAGVTTLYAHWKEKLYHIVVKNVLATASTIEVVDGKPVWKDVGYGNEKKLRYYLNTPYTAQITLPNKNDFTLEGFNFIGFSQNPKTPHYYAWKEKTKIYVKNLKLEEENPPTLIYPIYDEIKTTIKFNGGEVTASDGKKYKSDYSELKTFNYYGGFILPIPEAIEGFTFEGWEATRTVGGKKQTKIIEANNPYLKFSDYTDWFSSSGTYVYNAVWKEKEYTIEFNGGKIKASDGNEYKTDEKSTVTTKYYSEIKIPDDFTIDDFTLRGFGKEVNSKTAFLARNAKVTAGSIASELSETKTTKLYGMWEEDEVKVVFTGGKTKSSDGKIKESKSKSEKTYKLKTKVEIPNNFTLEGFNFKGFNSADQANTVTLETSDSNKKSATQLAQMVGRTGEGDVVFYGVWEEKRYNLEINAGTKEENGDTRIGTGSVAAKTYGYYSNVSMPTDETMKMKGFKLRGFNKDDNQDTVKYYPDQVVEIVDLIEYLTMDEIKTGNDNPYKLYGVWEVAGGTIKLDANIGYFSDNKREKTLKPEKMGKALSEYDGYEEPIETDEYIFSHWEDNKGNKYYPDSKIIGDIELTAKYKDKPQEEVKVPTYTVQVKNDERKGTYDGPTSFDIRLGDNIKASMSEAGVIDPVEKGRYIFLGWSFDGVNLISDKDLYTDINKNEIQAVYKEKTITITLSSGTGEFSNGERIITIVSTKSIALNTYVEYEEPTKEGYIFRTWLNDKTEVARNSIMAYDITLVASYEEVIIDEEDPKYTITIINDNTKGTYEGPSSFELAIDDNVFGAMQAKGIVNPVAKEGYKFIGWSWSGSEDNLIKSQERYINVNLRQIVAVYTKTTYTVTLSARDGAFANGSKTKTITSDTQVALNAFEGYEEPTKKGYKFKNWSSGGSVVEASIIVTSDEMTFIANYVEDKSEDDTEETTKPQESTEPGESTEPAESTEPGESTEPAESTEPGESETSKNPVDPENPETPVDPEPPIVEPKYTIVVENDNTKGTYTGPSSFSLSLESKILASMSEAGVVNPEAKEGYVFLGWSWSGNKDELVKAKDKYLDITLETIKAVYEEKTYTVTLSARDGVFANGERTKTIVSDTKVALNTFAGYEEPTKEEYVFKNWTNAGVVVASNSIITSDMTLVANFEKQKKEEIPEDQIKYTIAVENDDTMGTYQGPTSFELLFGSNILASMSELGVVDPVANKDYTFVGWSWTGNNNKLIKATDKYIDIRLATISTVYSQDTYKVTLSAGDGVFADGGKTKEIKSHSQVALNTFDEYEEPTKEDYEFVRWVDVNEAEVASTSIIKKDTVLYATFRRVAQDITDTRYTVTISNSDEKGVLKVKGEVKDVVTFKIGVGQDVLVTLASASITAEAKEGYVFKGWSWNGDISSLIKPGDLYTDSKNTTLKVVYTKENERTVVLKANTGIFKSFAGRTLTIVSETHKKLSDFNNYEEPVKEAATFDRWVKEDGTVFTKETFVDSDLILTAIYKDESGNDIGIDPDNKEGGANATYTVVVKNDTIKGTMSNAEKLTISGKEYEVALLDIKINDNILDKINEKGLTITPDDDRWIHEGWSKSEDLNDLIGEDDVYDSEEITEIIAGYYKIIHVKVVLNANTGVFESSGQRTKEMNTNRKTDLGDFRGYEEPIKSEGYTFVRWEDAENNKYEPTHAFGEESDNKTIELFAIYKDSNGNIVGRGDTKDGGTKAYYTVLTKYDKDKAKHNASSFEVQKDALVKQAMIDYDAYEAEEVEGWWEKGWSFDNTITNLIDDATLYDDTTKTKIYAQYVDTNKWTIVLNANTGLFKDNTREKVLVNTKKVAINKFSDYEVPEKSQGFVFDHWEDANGKTYKVTDSPSDPFDFVLYAIYKDKNGKVVGKDDTKEGEINATYTIRLSTDETKGTLGLVKKFEISKGSYILASMSEAGVKDPTPKENNFFVGWTWDKDLYEYVVTKDNIYKGSEGTVLHALYSDEVLDITLRANTGIFNSNNAREKTFQVPKYQLLRVGIGYEEPVKANATFNRWIKNDAPIGDLKSYMITESQTLDATYSANDGSNDNIGKDGDTQDGGENATYTIRVINDRNFGDYTGSEYFEIKEGEVIYTTMKKAGVTEGTPKQGYVFRGWKHGRDLISAITRYEDTSNTALHLDYANQTIELILDASFGRFNDKTQQKIINVARGRVINTIEEYEEPTKQNWTFSRWIDEQEVEVASSSALPLDVQRLKLKAKYKNVDGKEVDEDSHKHFICGSTDETASHALDVVSTHDEQISYYPVSNVEEFMNYIDAEMAKTPTERDDIKLYLEENIEIDKNIELDDGVSLYICLNGHTLTASEIGSLVEKSGKVYVTNCKDEEASVVEKKNNTEGGLFGENSLQVLSSKGKINIVPSGKLVSVISSDSIVPKEIVLMNVNIENSDGINTDSFITAKGHSRVRLVDVDIKNVSVTDTLLATLEGAELIIGGVVNISNNITNKAIMNVGDTFRISDNSVLSVVENTLLKKENGDTAVIFIGGLNNYVGGNLIVRDNKLELSEEYKELVNSKDEEEKEDNVNNNDDLFTFGNLFGSYDEAVSPAGDVGYSSAIAFTKENIGFDVGNAKIEIYGNESVSSDSNVRAEYMYQLRALSNNSNPLLRQTSGTSIDENSIIGVAFATEDGEGVLSDSAKIGKEIFRNKTFGKEEKLLNIKENEENLELARKTYTVVYYEGTPTTNEQKKEIEVFMPDGSTISETTRVRSEVKKAGHDVQLEDNNIYRVKGFDLATYSLINKNGEVLGAFDPRATVSYIDSLFGDGKDIEDGDVIRADSNYQERSLKSEAKPLVITKEEYDEMVSAAVAEAVAKVASDSELEQVVEDNDEDYYTIRYHLEGGQIENISLIDNDYYEVARISKKEDYVLMSGGTKVVSEAGVEKEYNFTGWYFEEDNDSPVTKIEANTVDEEVIEVYAHYLPSTYKITYHLEGGSIAGYEGDTIEETVNRMINYTLIKGVTKPNYVFIRWRIEDGESIIYTDEIEAEDILNDIDAYAEYDTALYEVTYNLNGGIIKDLTNEGDEVYIDKNANISKDYYLPQVVTKEDYRFTGWETVRGVKVDKIEAGDTDESKRNVVATFAPSTWKIVYDTDGGTINGFEKGNVTEKVDEGEEYTLYTDVKKEGYEFAYWYDVKEPTTKIDVITDAVGGHEYKVKAKYNTLKYDLRLHLDEGVNPFVLRGISNKVDYVLPTAIEVDDKEFVNWSYKDANGSDVFISYIEAGNPNNITDIYANYEDLLTWRIIYHLGPDEFIEGITEYDPTSTSEEKTKTLVVNRRKNAALYTKVVKEGKTEDGDDDEYKPIIIAGAESSNDELDKAAEKKYEFYGWTTNKVLPDALGDESASSTIKLVNGISKESEAVRMQEEDSRYSKEKDWHLYPYFTTAHSETVDVEYHFVNGGELPNKEMVDGKCVETIAVENGLSLKNYYDMEPDSLCDGYRFDGFYLNEDCAGGRVVTYGKDLLQQKADAGETIHIYVKFTKIRYNLKYNLNGGSMPGKRLSENNTVFNTTYDNRNEVILDTNIIREGYVFEGWRESDDEDAKIISKIEKDNDSDVEVYASWKKDSYQITYNLNGGRISGKPSGTYTETYKRSVRNVLPTEVTKTRNKFMGWFTEPNGQGTKYEVVEVRDTETDDLTLYAYFKSTAYTIAYVLNGGYIKGKGGPGMMYLMEVHDSSQEFDLYGKDDVAYDDAGVFDKWLDEDGNAYTRIEKGHEGDLTLYAQYITKKVDITFNVGQYAVVRGIRTKDGKYVKSLNVGKDTVLPTSADIYYPSISRSRLTGQIYDEFVFGGWYTNEECKGNKVEVIPKDNPNNITELYAKWESNVYRVVYHLNGGVIPLLTTVKDTDTAIDNASKFEEYELPTFVKKNNSEFEGWYDNEKLTGKPIKKLEANAKQRVDNEVHLYAKWKKTKNTIEYQYYLEKYGDFARRFTVENNAPYVLYSDGDFVVSEFTNDEILFDGWYKKDKNGELVGSEIIYIEANTEEDIVVGPKLLKLSEVSFNQLQSYYMRQSRRMIAVQSAKLHRQNVIHANAEKAAESARQGLEIGSIEFYDNIIKVYVGSIQNEENKKEEVKPEVKEDQKNLFGELAKSFGKLFGDGPEDDEDSEESIDPAVPNPDEIEVNTSDLLAYDTVSAERLGVKTPQGTVLDFVVITYLKDAEGNSITDPEFIGKVLKAGGDFSDIADKYPGHLLGLRAVFLDEKIYEKPAQPNNPSGGGRKRGGGGGGSAGGGGGGIKRPVTFDAITVNPYGIDGRGSDNGAKRAKALKLDINTKLGRIATLNYAEYKTIDASETKETTFAGLTSETWEYFPASNEFKLFLNAPNGDRYYITNGWRKSTSDNQTNWYRFDKDGLMQRGFVEDGGNVYYLNNTLSGLAYMVTGFKDFEGTGYTGYFRKDGVLVSIFPTAARATYERNTSALPEKPNFDKAIYGLCRHIDSEKTRLISSEKVYGQSAMGNFVGYWYKLASGQRKFRFETINRNLQVAKFATNGWMNFYDTNSVLHSYRFDSDANLVSNTITVDGLVVGEDGSMAGNTVLLDFSVASKSEYLKYELATITLNTLPVTEGATLRSRFVEENGVPLTESLATDVWTNINFEGKEPVFTNQVMNALAMIIQQQRLQEQQQELLPPPIHLLSNTVNAVTEALVIPIIDPISQLDQVEEIVPIIDPVGINKELNVLKITKVLVNWFLNRA